MSSLAKNMKTLAAVVGLAAAGVATGAQAQTACGVQGIAGGQAATVNYDPFNPTGLSSTTVTMSITRINPAGGGKTSDLNFYLAPGSGTGTAANGIQIIPRTFSGQGSMTGAGLNIFYDYPITGAPSLEPITNVPSSGSRFVKLEYNGNPGQADTATVTFDVIMPANLNLNASTTLAFDAVFACKMQGGQYNNQTDRGTSPNAIVFPVKVLSALRANYAGTALDFGEIGQVPATPSPAVRTNPANHILVLSSGAYNIKLESLNGYKLNNGGNSPNDYIGYSLKFLGQVRGPSAATEIYKSCTRAGMFSTGGEQLPIQASLVEGGAGKNPSEHYEDQLTVTITPEAYNVVGTDVCGSYSVP